MNTASPQKWTGTCESMSIALAFSVIVAIIRSATPLLWWVWGGHGSNVVPLNFHVYELLVVLCLYAYIVHSIVTSKSINWGPKSCAV